MTLSHKASTSSKSCVTIMHEVLVFLNNSLVSSLNSALKSLSKELKGSSNKTNLGSGAKVLAIATLCCSPPDKEFGKDLENFSAFKSLKKDKAFSSFSFLEPLIPNFTFSKAFK